MKCSASHFKNDDLKISDGGLKMRKSIAKTGGLFMVIFFCFVISPQLFGNEKS